jgi:excisionase family DNA binding protein
MKADPTAILQINSQCNLLVQAGHMDEEAAAVVLGTLESKLWTRVDFATAAKVSTRTVDRWLRNGTIRGSRIGGAVRIRATELDRVLSEVGS